MGSIYILKFKNYKEYLKNNGFHFFFWRGGGAQKSLKIKIKIV